MRTLAVEKTDSWLCLVLSNGLPTRNMVYRSLRGDSGDFSLVCLTHTRYECIYIIGSGLRPAPQSRVLPFRQIVSSTHGTSQVRSAEYDRIVYLAELC